MKSMFSALWAVVFLSLGVGTASALEPVDGPVLLTVHGAIENTNRGPLDPFHDVLLGFQGAEFEKAAVFDRRALLALDGGRIETTASGWPDRYAFEGPRLDVILAAVGATGATVSIVALDGYSVDLSMDDIRRYRPILALVRDGEPLAFGGRGPMWLIFPRDDFAELMAEEDDARWVWAVTRIEVK